MALEKTINFNIDGELEVTIENSYIKIMSFCGNKERLNLTVGFFKESDSTNPVKVSNIVVPISLDGDNFIKQAYEYLKTLPEFASATDV
jgi:hypothetical protein